MPGLHVKGNELHYPAIPRYEQVRGHLQVCDFLEIGVVIRIEGIAKQLSDVFRTKLTWRQADVMNHEQIYFLRSRTLALIWGMDLCDPEQPAILN